MQITIGELANWAGGYLTSDDVNRRVTDISTDSRTVEPGEAFVALRGLNFDGHEFVAEAAQRNASVMLVDNEACLAGAAGIIVPDTLTALGNIAHRFRWIEPLIPWIAVTGSNGKTTTREMIAHILRIRGPVSTPHGNFNNLVGVPLSILARSDDAWIGVIEIGASLPNEVATLAHIVTPTIGIVTTTGPAHLEGFGTLETIAHEKASIYERLPHDGVAIYPANDPRSHILREHIHGNRASFAIEGAADMTAENMHPHEDGTSFSVRGVNFELPLLGLHNVENCLAALLAAEHMGIGLAEAAEALTEMQGVRQRLEKIQTEHLTILNDVYNANPDSLLAGVETLLHFDAPRRVVIIGDMLELGTQSRALHREVGQSLSRSGVDSIYAVGKHCLSLAEAAAASSARINVRHFSTVPMLIKHLKKYIKKEDAILVKGSRGMKMETVTDALKRFQPDSHPKK